MKKNWHYYFVIILILFITSLAHAQSSETAQVRVMPDSIQVPQGTTIDLAVEVIEIQDLYAFDISLTFDPTVIQVVDADPDLDGIQVNYGMFLDPGFVLRNEVDNQAGTIRFALTQLNPSQPKSGSGVLIVIRLEGGQVGAQTSLTLTHAELVERDGSDIPTTMNSGEVEVVGTATPGPTNTPIPTQDPGTPLPTSLPATSTPIRTVTAGPSPTSTPEPSSTPTTTPTATDSPTLTPEPSFTPTYTLVASSNQETESSPSNEELAQTVVSMIPTHPADETPQDSSGKSPYVIAGIVIGSVGICSLLVGGYLYIKQNEKSPS